MNKRERVRRIFSGQKTDRPAYSFSKHFPTDFAYGEAGIKNHLDFYSESGVDIMKIMNEHLMPYLGRIDEPKGWLRVKELKKDAFFITLLLDFAKRIREELGEDHYYMLTVHGVIACTIHLSLRQFGYYDARRVHLEHCRQNPQIMKDAHAYIAELLLEIIRQSAGQCTDAIYFASLGGDRQHLTDEEFAEFIAPFEEDILRISQNEFKSVNVLHMCKEQLQMRRYLPYAPFVKGVNWGIYENDISLQEGAALFPEKVILGGFSNTDADLLKGNEKAIKAKTLALAEQMKRQERFIIGADCTLPTWVDNQSLRFIGEALENKNFEKEL